MKNIILTFMVLVGFLAPSIGNTNDEFVPGFILSAARTYNVDPVLMYAICRVESRCKASAINKDDARASEKLRGVKRASHGLFQLQLSLARGLGFKGTRKQLLNPATNAMYAAKYLHLLFEEYGDTVTVIYAYNAGETVVNRWLNHHQRYKLKNRSYVHTVLKHYVHSKEEFKEFFKQ